MGRTGYSDKENTNNIEIVHLHLGLELIFDESQKECDNEIWIDVYNIVKLLSRHRVTLQKAEDGWQRAYPYRDLDRDGGFRSPAALLPSTAPAPVPPVPAFPGLCSRGDDTG